MFCKYCGNKVDDTAKFCESCGSPIEPLAEKEHVATPLDNLMNLADVAKRNAHADKILALGITSVAFASSCILALVGWIIACVARGQVRDYENKYGPVSGKAKVGKDLARGGLIASICMTIFWTGYLLLYVVIFAAAFGATGGDYYYIFTDVPLILRNLFF